MDEDGWDESLSGISGPVVGAVTAGGTVGCVSAMLPASLARRYDRSVEAGGNLRRPRALRLCYGSRTVTRVSCWSTREHSRTTCNDLCSSATVWTVMWAVHRRLCWCCCSVGG